jgi:hypothetical protein
VTPQAETCSADTLTLDRDGSIAARPYAIFSKKAESGLTRKGALRRVAVLIYPGGTGANTLIEMCFLIHLPRSR